MIRRSLPCACALLFIALAVPFIPYPGIQNDEALFAAALYEPIGVAANIRIFKTDVPLMLMSYLGTLKAAIYALVFKLWTPSAVSLRLPMVFAGAISVWLFYRLVRRIAGDQTALIGCILLATDATFVLTTTLDWGPVALQHLLLVSGLLAIIRFYQTKGGLSLAAGFFFLGLAMWDKALAVWMLSGLAVATVAVFPRELWRSLSVSRVAIAVAAFALGALPLVIYNFRFEFETFSSNTQFEIGDVPGKSYQLRLGLAGGPLFGYLVREIPDEHSRAPASPLEHAAVRLSDATGNRRESWFPYALALSMLLLPWLGPARRTLLFCLLAFVVAWLQMAMTKGAGGSAHHVVLLWPLPHLFLAVACAAAARRIPRIRWVVAAAVAGVALSSLLVTNEYLARLVRNGPSRTWTDAIYPLSAYLGGLKAKQIFINDWGMLDSLRLLNRGRLPLAVGSDGLSKPVLDDYDRRVVGSRMAVPGAVFVAHTDGNEEFKGVNAQQRALAAEAGYRIEVLARIADRHGREMFEVFRLVK